VDWEVDKKNQIIDFYIEGEREKAHSGIGMDTIPDICEKLLTDAGYIIDWRAIFFQFLTKES